MANLQNQLRLLGARNVVVSTNAQVRRDGLPYARQRVDDAGVAVYFDLNGQPQCIPCDKWRAIGENVHAVGKTVEALRGLERWGAKEMVNAAFRGFAALPPPSGEPLTLADEPWYEVLQVSPNADPDVIRAAYRRLIHKHHPDTGGDVESFKRIQRAYEATR